MVRIMSDKTTFDQAIDQAPVNLVPNLNLADNDNDSSYIPSLSRQIPAQAEESENTGNVKSLAKSPELISINSETNLRETLEKIENYSYYYFVKWEDGWDEGRNSESANKLKQLIDEQAEINLAESQHYPPPFIHALLSAHVYSDCTKNEDVKFKDFIYLEYNAYVKDWKILKIFDFKEADDYYSVLYINEKTNNVVHVYRGTDITGSLNNENKSLIFDLKSVFGKELGSQEKASFESLVDIMKNCRRK